MNHQTVLEPMSTGNPIYALRKTVSNLMSTYYSAGYYKYEMSSVIDYEDRWKRTIYDATQ